MNIIIETLLREATSDDMETKSFAILRLGLILEKHTIRNWYDDSTFISNLTEEMIILKLSLEEQREIVVVLCNLARNITDQRYGYFWAIGKALGEVAGDLLIELVHEGYAESDGWTFHSAVIALQNCCITEDWQAENSPGVPFFNLKTFIRQALTHPNPVIAKYAQSVVDRDFGSFSAPI